MKKISVVGLGIKEGGKQLTLSAIEEIKKTEKVIILSHDVNALTKTLKQYGIHHFHFINELYENSANDQDNYDSIFNYLIKQLKKYNFISFLCTGHPRLGMTIVQMLEKSAGENNFEMTVIEGISSFDTMINDLRIDPLERGSMILDVNRLLLFDISLPTDVNIFLYHITSIGTKVVNYKKYASFNKVIFLRDKLLLHFQPDKTLYLITSASNKNDKPSIIPFKLSDIEDCIKNALFWSSLYIPANKCKKINNKFMNVLINDNDNII